MLALRESVHRLVSQLGELATQDSLTGALNRGAFEQRLEAELARTDRIAAPCALVVLDIDHFKRINDTQGHAAGDSALRRSPTRSRRRSAARTCSAASAARSSRSCCPTPGSRAPRRSPRSCASTLGDTMGDVTVSFGVTDAHTAGRTVRGMLHSADLALYRAKRAGRDRVVRRRA